jgi:hypothetical protein
MIWICFFRSRIESLVFLSPRETFNREFFVEKVLADFDEEGRRIGRRTRPGALSSNLTMQCRIGHPEISIVSESQDSLIRPTARIWYFVTSGYSKRGKEGWKDVCFGIQSK